MTDEKIIDQYLRGNLSDKEEASFIARIKANREFKNKVLIKVLLIKAIREVGSKQDKRIIRSVKDKLTWKKYILIYGMYGNYFFTDNLSRYNSIFNHKSNASIM